MIEDFYKEGIKVTDILEALGGSKQTIYTVINYLKEGTLLMITISDIKSIINAAAGIKQIFRKQKKTLFKLI